MNHEKFYGRPKPSQQPFPRDLAAKIARKADVMAKRFEQQALEQMTKAARSALYRGMEPDQIARELQL